MGLWSWISGSKRQPEPASPPKRVVRVTASPAPPSAPPRAYTPPPRVVHTAATLAAELHERFPEGVMVSEVKKTARPLGLDVNEVGRLVDELEGRRGVKVVTVDPSSLRIVDLTELESTRYRVVGQSFWLTELERRRLGGREYLLIREPDNEVDPMAVAVYSEGRKVGFLSAGRAGMLSPLLKQLDADAFRVTGAVSTTGSLKMMVDLPTVPVLRKFLKQNTP